MKKFLAILVLGLFWCNVAYAATPQGVYHLYIIIKEFIAEYGFTFSFQALFIYIVLFWVVAGIIYVIRKWSNKKK